MNYTVISGFLININISYKNINISYKNINIRLSTLRENVPKKFKH